MSDAGEVKTLADLGITSINLTSNGKTDASQDGMLVHGTTTQNGHTFNVYQYSGDQSLQVLIDQHIVQSNVHLS